MHHSSMRAYSVDLREKIVDTALGRGVPKALSRRSGTQQRVVELKRRPSIYSTSFAIEELGVRLQDGTSPRLLLI